MFQKFLLERIFRNVATKSEREVPTRKTVFESKKKAFQVRTELHKVIFRKVSFSLFFFIFSIERTLKNGESTIK